MNNSRSAIWTLLKRHVFASLTWKKNQIQPTREENRKEQLYGNMNTLQSEISII